MGASPGPPRAGHMGTQPQTSHLLVLLPVLRPGVFDAQGRARAQSWGKGLIFHLPGGYS